MNGQTEICRPEIYRVDETKPSATAAVMISKGPGTNEKRIDFGMSKWAKPLYKMHSFSFETGR